MRADFQRKDMPNGLVTWTFKGVTMVMIPPDTTWSARAMAAYERRVEAALTGKCACGGVIDNVEPRAPGQASGQIAHEADCDVPDEKFLALITREAATGVRAVGQLRAAIPNDLFPSTGARILAAHTDGGSLPVTAVCQHGMLALGAGDLTVLVHQFESSDPCRVNEIREVFHPARLAERASRRDDLSGSVAAFLVANPPEECGCDPDLAVQVAYPPGPSGMIVVNLEHEPWCPRGGQPSHGSGALPGRA